MARAFGVAHVARASTCRPTSRPAARSATGRAGWRYWQANKADYCAAAKKGYPDVANPTDRAYLTQLASENCTDGWRYFAGNNADTAIGQGDTTVSPLQLATAYSAMVNGGTLYAPTLGWAVLDAAGKVVRTITPKVVRKVPVAKADLDFFGDSLHFEDSHSVSGALAFDGSPIKTADRRQDRHRRGVRQAGHLVAGVLGPGAARRAGQQRRFVVVGMVEQAGTGASAAAPMVRKVFEGLLGANGTPVLPAACRPASCRAVTPRHRRPRAGRSAAASAGPAPRPRARPASGAGPASGPAGTPGSSAGPPAVTQRWPSTAARPSRARTTADGRPMTGRWCRPARRCAPMADSRRLRSYDLVLLAAALLLCLIGARAGLVGHPYPAGAGRWQPADLPGQAPAQHRPGRGTAVLRGPGRLAGCCG